MWWLVWFSSSTRLNVSNNLLVTPSSFPFSFVPPRIPHTDQLHLFSMDIYLKQYMIIQVYTNYMFCFYNAFILVEASPGKINPFCFSKPISFVLIITITIIIDNHNKNNNNKYFFYYYHHYYGSCIQPIQLKLFHLWNKFISSYPIYPCISRPFTA